MKASIVIAQEFRSQSSRYVLVALSMLLGVVSLVAVALGQSVAADMLIAQEEQLNGREASFEVSVKTNPQTTASVMSDSAKELMDEISASSGNRLVAGSVEVELAGSVQSIADTSQGRPGQAVSTIWTLGDRNEMYRLPLTEGERSVNSCFPGEITVNVATRATLSIRPGAVLRLHIDGSSPPRNVVVSGVVADGQTRPNLYGSWGLLECTLGSEAPISDSAFRFVVDPADAGTVEAVVSDALGRRGMSIEGGFRRVDTVGNVRDQVGILSTIFTVCAALVLVVSAMGIASVGISSVRERARELLVRRAFGAKRSDVMLQVLSGAALAGVAVGLLGFGLAIILTYVLIPTALPVGSSINPPTFPWGAGIVGLCAGLGTGLLGGAIPAIAATRLPIAEALRR